mgnify:CR=1 FL=1|jgi:hypothetical protein
MNPIIFPIVIVAAILLWFMLSALFKPFGRLLEYLLENVEKSFKEENKNVENKEDKKDE